VSGRMYPVEVRYRPIQPQGSIDPEYEAKNRSKDEARNEDKEEDDIEQSILDALDEIAGAGTGDVLIFLPGEREIRETAEALRKHGASRSGGRNIAGMEILPLFARLSYAEQERVFK